MTNNEKLTLDHVTSFIDEAKRRGIYTSSQGSMIASWQVYLSKVLPSGVTPETLTVGDALEKLSEFMQLYAAQAGVKVASVTTYQTKVRRLLSEFITYNGAPEAKWFTWKQQSEKKSAQASAAASAKGKKAPQKGDSPSDPEVAILGAATDAPKMMLHILPLPGGKRRAELRLPVDLRLSDFTALEKTFKAIISLEKARVEVINLAEDGQAEGDNAGQ
jgi:hypothetical protein